MNPAPVIAIDGPSASGKGSIAGLVATALGFHYLESGALYRLVAYAGGTDPAQAAADLDVAFRDGAILFMGQDVSGPIHTEAVGNRASEVAKIPAVRSVLLERQRAFRRPPGLVADGRDMGTVVFPDASLKVFLTASVAVRAQRRHKQLIDKGIHANLVALSRDLEERDARDATRAVAPLRPAEGAVVLDSTALSIDEVVDKVLTLFRKRTGGAP